MRDVATVNFV